MQKIYIIMGASGNYDNYTQWLAKSFFDKGVAEDYLDKLNEIATKTHRDDQRKLGKSEEEVSEAQRELLPELLKLDEKALMEFDGLFTT